MALRIAVPNKGRLCDDATDILRRIGIRVPRDRKRTLMSTTNAGQYEVLFSRAEDIPEFIELGAADIGITGLDLVSESNCKVDHLLDLQFGHCKLIVAAPEGKDYATLEDLPKDARVATSFPHLTEKFFKERKMTVDIVPVSGAAEITPYIGVSDAITDLTQSGATLKQNHLTMLDVILDSWAVMIGGPGALKNRTLVDDLTHAVESVQAAGHKRYLMANVREDTIEEVGRIIPGLAGPTVMKLSVKGMVAVHAVVDEDDLNSVIPRLKRAGATGILVLPIARLVP